MGIKRHNHFITDLFNQVKEYADKYQCSIENSIYDLDFPITHSDVKELAKLANITFTQDQINRLGRSEELVTDWLIEDQADYNYHYGQD